MSIVSLSHRSDLVELIGLITCVEGGVVQMAKLLVLVRRCACESSYGNNKRWVKHEKEKNEDVEQRHMCKDPVRHF